MEPGLEERKDRRSFVELVGPKGCHRQLVIEQVEDTRAAVVAFRTLVVALAKLHTLAIVLVKLRTLATAQAKLHTLVATDPSLAIHTLFTTTKQLHMVEHHY